MLTTSLIHHILLSCQSSRENAHMQSLLVLFQGQASVSVPSCGQAGNGGPTWVTAQALGNSLWPFTLFPLLYPSLPSHISLPIEPAEGSWQMPKKRNHNSCRSATYANMFTHEGIRSKENLPHCNS